MEHEQYTQIAHFEEVNWWYRARRGLLEAILQRFAPHAAHLLDAGCGVGSNGAVLRRYASQVSGLDTSPEALAYCRAKGYDNLICASLEDGLGTDIYDGIICLDVLEHITDDARAVAALQQGLKGGGIGVMAVPAHAYLWNDNDRFSHHLRRYTPKQVRSLISSNGLAIIKLSYWNQISYLPYLLYCMGQRKKAEHPVNNLTHIPRSLNGLLSAALKLENKLFMRMNLLQGVSIVCVCRKPAE